MKWLHGYAHASLILKLVRVRRGPVWNASTRARMIRNCKDIAVKSQRVQHYVMAAIA